MNLLSKKQVCPTFITPQMNTDSNNTPLILWNDDLTTWITKRFRYLYGNKRHDDAIEFANEWFEWLDPNNYINESTLFYNENDLRELYESIK